MERRRRDLVQADLLIYNNTNDHFRDVTKMIELTPLQRKKENVPYYSIYIMKKQHGKR